LRGRGFEETRLLRASFVERFTMCGKINCACARSHKHGPFYYLTANLDAGQIRKFLRKTATQRQTIQRGVAGYQARWKRLEELSQINLELPRRGEPGLRPAKFNPPIAKARIHTTFRNPC
jgi:hypothetical protein